MDIKNKYDMAEDFLKDYIPKADMLSHQIDIELNKLTPDHVFSDTFESKMKKIIKKHSKKHTPPLKFNIRKRVLIILVLILLINALLIACVPSYKKIIFDKFIENYDKFTKITTRVENHSMDDVETIFKEPIYIPEGFVEVERIEFVKTLTLEYRNEQEDKIIYIQKLISNSGKIIDTENTKIDIKTINNHDVQMIYNKGTYNIFWTYNNCDFSLIANIDYDELVKIIESIEKK